MRHKLAGLAVIALLSGCVGIATQDRTRTQIVTFPDKAQIEMNGKLLGDSPVLIEMPRDAKGQLAEAVVIHAIPRNSDEFEQVREFSAGRTNPIPLRVMIDMRRQGTNDVPQPPTEGGIAPSARAPSKAIEPALSPRARANQIVIGIPIR